MSAFYDIWIGQPANGHPKYTRFDNEQWNNTTELNEQCWLSLPPGKKDFILTASTDTYKIILLGQLYEDIDATSLLNRCIAYTEGKGFNDPAGHYIIFLYSLLAKRYYIFTNRLGTYHAYYSNIGGQKSISTYYIGLAKQAQTKQLDWESISGFMAMGFFPGTSTYLQGINVLAPASCYSFDEELNIIDQNRYWNWHYKPVPRSVESINAGLNAILSASLSYALKDKRACIPISGGLDSRMLTGKLTDGSVNTQKALWSYSYGLSHNSPETKIAGEVAAVAELSFKAYTTPNYLFDKADEITDAVELFQYINGTRQAAMTEVLGKDADVVIGGHWGDVWMDDMHVDNMPPEEYFRNKIIKKGSRWLLDEVCTPQLAAAVTVAETYFNKWEHEHKHIGDKDFRMKVFKTDQWSFRWTVPSLRMYQSGAMPVLPFYDKRIVDLFTTVPTETVKSRSLQIEFIKQYYPKLAAIKWQEYDSNLFRYKTINNRNLAYRAVKKLQRKLSNTKTITRNWELFYLNPAGKSGLEDILLNNKAFCEIVPAEKTRQLLDIFYKDPSAANGYTVSMMHTFAQFMKTVFA